MSATPLPTTLEPELARVERLLEDLTKPIYEPNLGERFAEACRLLQTNPNLLRLGRPRRWATLVDTYGLVPAHDLPWDEVLRARGAHDRFLAAAKNWLAR